MVTRSAGDPDNINQHEGPYCKAEGVGFVSLLCIVLFFYCGMLPNKAGKDSIKVLRSHKKQFNVVNPDGILLQ